MTKIVCTCYNTVQDSIARFPGNDRQFCNRLMKIVSLETVEIMSSRTTPTLPVLQASRNVCLGENTLLVKDGMTKIVYIRDSIHVARFPGNDRQFQFCN